MANLQTAIKHWLARQFPNKWLPFYRSLLCLLISTLFFLHTAGWQTMPVLARVENVFYDLRLRSTLTNTVDPRIVIVTINEESLAQEGRWPWSRDKMAYLMDMLFDYYGIKLLGFDVVFAETDTSSGVKVLNQLAQGPLQQDSQYINALNSLLPQLSYDEIFAKSLANRPTVLGYFTSHIKEKNPETGKLPEAVAQSQAFAFSNLLFNAQSYTGNLDILQNAAASAGFFNNPSIDQDGIYRKLPLLVNFQGQLYEALSLALFRTLLGSPAMEFTSNEDYRLDKSDSRLEGLNIEGFTIPVDENGAILVPYRGKKGSFNYISAADVLNGTTDIDKLKDKIVIFGATAAGLLDSRATPVQSIYPGVEIHANVLSALLDQTIKSRPNYILAAELAEILVICLIAITVFPRLSALMSVIVFGLFSLAEIAANYYCWQILNIDTVLAAPISLLSLLFGIQLFFGFFLESRRKKQLSTMFGQYVPQELVAQMSQSEQQFSLQGESREMTVFFSDIRGFTSISESMEPQALCELINAILTPVTRIIHETQGTIDKYIGDAVMAFWGAPLPTPQHASNAVKSALAITDKLSAMQPELTNKGWPAIEMGIGINTGIMNVGNMGSEFRIAYTVMGDAVNLGSRLESLTKQYGVKIIVSETTMHAAPDFTYRELDCVRVKGKLKPISIYEPLGETAAITNQQQLMLADLKQALALYRHQHWVSAEEIFSQLHKDFPTDKLYKIYLERIQLYQQTPPTSDWDGVFTHTAK